jgi:small subunit ribosomal protein S1
VVTFGAFVEIMDGVEGLVHISELAHHHVENPREIVEPGQDVRVKILEIDSERRRLSLSVKRVEEQLPHIKSAAAAGAAAAGTSEEIGDVPDLGLSEDVFAGPQVSGADDLRAALSGVEPAQDAETPSTAEPVAEEQPPPEAAVAEPAPAPEAEPAPAAEPALEPEPEPEAEAAVREAEPAGEPAPEAEPAPETEPAPEPDAAAPDAQQLDSSGEEQPA